ncbi:hypothetical protein [Austwickia chelonae]|uniref:hypothetical protein n=1 Tax=Austwickia chelonae TaxID=100225 RepID=UPI000E28446F|nr:hypothetical protein [Austwickia chelonae]
MTGTNKPAWVVLVACALVAPLPPAQAQSVERTPNAEVTGTVDYRAVVQPSPAGEGAFEGVDVDSLGRILARQGPEATDRKDFVGDVFGRRRMLSQKATGCGPVSRAYADRPIGIATSGAVVGEGRCTYPGGQAPFTAVSVWSSVASDPRVIHEKPYWSGAVVPVAVSDRGEALLRERVYAENGEETTATVRSGIRLLDVQARSWPVVGTDIAADGTVVGQLLDTHGSAQAGAFVTEGFIATPLPLPAGAGSVNSVAVSPNGRSIVAATETVGVRWDVRRAPGSLPSGFSPVDVNDHGVVLGRAGEGWAVWSPLGGLRSVRLPGLPAGVRVKSMAKINWWGQIAATVTGTDGIDRAALLSPGR